MTTNHCVVTFLTSKGKRKSIRISNPRTNLTSPIIIAGMAAFISNDMFNDSVGRLVRVSGAKIVAQTTTNRTSY